MFSKPLAGSRVESRALFTAADQCKSHLPDFARHQARPISFAWIDLPLPGRHIPKERMHSAVCQLGRWLQLASEVGTKAGVFAAFGQSWNYASFQTLMQSHGFRKTYHRACHFGLKLDPQQEAPSKICFVFLGNKDVSPHPCLQVQDLAE